MCRNWFLTLFFLASVLQADVIDEEDRELIALQIVPGSSFLDNSHFHLCSLSVDAVFEEMRLVGSVLDQLRLTVEEKDLSLDSVGATLKVAQQCSMQAMGILHSIEKLQEQAASEFIHRQNRIQKAFGFLALHCSPESSLNEVDKMDFGNDCIAANRDEYLAGLGFFNTSTLHRQLRLDEVFFVKFGKRLQHLHTELEQLMQFIYALHEQHQYKDAVLIDLSQGIYGSLGDFRLIMEFGDEIFDSSSTISDDGRAAARILRLRHKMRPQILQASVMLESMENILSNGMSLLLDMEEENNLALNQIRKLLPQVHRFKLDDIASAEKMLSF